MKKYRPILIILMMVAVGTALAETILEPDVIPEAGSPGAPVEGANIERWNAGRLLFDHDFGRGEGLGPLFNADSCQACHNLGGIGGAGKLDLNVFRVAEGAGDPADPFSENSFVRFIDEGPLLSRVSDSSDWPEALPSGMSFLFEQRNGPALFGLGLFESISDEAILAHEDLEDEDGDGIRGRAHVANGTVHKFGWKAQIPSVKDFVFDAFGNELGMTSDAASDFAIASDSDAVPDPELDDETEDLVTEYIAGLAAIEPRALTAGADQVKRDNGSDLFEEVGCTKCHVPSLDDALPVNAYTDLLLHDVQGDDYQGIPDGEATGREFRTAPLWGIRLSAPYWHDGHAENIVEAIAAHQGTASSVISEYERLSTTEQEALVFFVEQL